MLNITSASEYEAAKLSHPKLVVHFWAEWCEPCSQLDKVLELAIEEFKENNNGSDSVTCARVEAEQVVDVSEKCKVTVVPLFIFYSGGKELDRLEGADAAGLHAKFMALASGQSSTAKPVPAAQPPTEVVPLQQRLERLVRQQPVMLFMKVKRGGRINSSNINKLLMAAGTPDQPRCGFSSKVVQALRGIGRNFGSFDILTDEQVRQGLKEYSSWPTYPQLYVNGELLGGCDIVLEMASAGELESAINDML